MFSQSKVIFIGIAVLLVVIACTILRNKPGGVGGNSGDNGREDCTMVQQENSPSAFLKCKTRKPLVNKIIFITDTGKDDTEKDDKAQYFIRVGKTFRKDSAFYTEIPDMRWDEVGNRLINMVYHLDDTNSVKA